MKKEMAKDFLDTLFTLCVASAALLLCMKTVCFTDFHLLEIPEEKPGKFNHTMPMLSTPIEDFEGMAELQFPLLINPSNCTEEEFCSDYCLAEYSLDRKFELEEFLDVAEMYSDLILLFKHIPSPDTDAGQSVCLYSAPRERHMFKFYARTNAAGVFDSIIVTIYHSHDTMREALTEDLRRIRELPGKLSCRSRKDLDIDFMVLP